MSANRFPTSEIHTDGIKIRRLGDEDLAAVKRLAQLDSHHPPEGALLGVEIDGRLLAAISLASGESVADPFSRTGELRALLELRAAQLRRRENGRRRLRRHLPQPATRAALAGGPPDAARSWLIVRRWRPS
jgi:hypothetical protein